MPQSPKWSIFFQLQRGLNCFNFSSRQRAVWCKPARFIAHFQLAPQEGNPLTFQTPKSCFSKPSDANISFAFLYNYLHSGRIFFQIDISEFRRAPRCWVSCSLFPFPRKFCSLASHLVSLRLDRSVQDSVNTKSCDGRSSAEK